MKLKIEIELDNEAFRGFTGTEEVARLLQDVGERIPDPLWTTNGELSLHDRNGNWVGYAAIVPGEVDERRDRR